MKSPQTRRLTAWSNRARRWSSSKWLQMGRSVTHPRVANAPLRIQSRSIAVNAPDAQVGERDSASRAQEEARSPSPYH